jgi:copper chaperone NosL
MTIYRSFKNWLIMNNRISIVSRMIAGICALLLTGVLVLPIWRIELSAPQYPEGLVLKIYAGKLGGDLDVVNGLNHYIGMRTLHAKDFVEFAVLPYIIGTLVIFGILTVIINRKWFLLTWAGFYLLFAITAMIDFYRWEYNYGHNLDPTAPIQIPGMAYQPPLIGFKQLLNFGAYSIPDSGGWIFIGVALLLVVAACKELWKPKKTAVPLRTTAQVAAMVFICLLAACSSGPQPIRFGSDACYFCKMTLTDHHYGAEVVTKKGKAYKFDDIHCLHAFMKSGEIEEKQVADIYLVDFAAKAALVKAEESFLLTGDALHAPMGGNVAAFGTQDSLKKYQEQLSATITTWHEINK